MARSEKPMQEKWEKGHHRSGLIIVMTVMGVLLIPAAVAWSETGRGSVVVTRTYHPPNPDVLDGFGMALAGYQNLALVGAPNEVHDGHEAGMAYLVDRGTSRVMHVLELPGPTGGALFGQSVALNGRFAGIGAPHSRDGAGTYTGGVYLYDRVTGKHTRTITNPNPVTGIFGHAIAMSETRLLVGDPQASTDVTYYTGAAYVFDLTTGERLVTLQPPGGAVGRRGWFGHAVALSESIYVVSAPHEQKDSVPSGVVYGFDAGSGGLIQIFVNPHPTESFFGWSLALADDLLFVGGFGYRGTYEEEGIVYVFQAASGKLLRTVNNPEPHEGAQFGKTVAILPKFLIVGAPGESFNETGMPSGAVYVFDRKSGKLLDKIVNPGKPSGADDLFGVALATANEHLLVGAPFGGNDNELDAGLVYEFELSP